MLALAPPTCLSLSGRLAHIVSHNLQVLAQQFANAAQKHAPHLMQGLVQLVGKAGNGACYAASSILRSCHSIAVPAILCLAVGVACDLQQPDRQFSSQRQLSLHAMEPLCKPDSLLPDIQAAAWRGPSIPIGI